MKFLENLDDRERVFVLVFVALLVLLGIAIALNKFYDLRSSLALEVKENVQLLQQLKRLKVKISSLAPTKDLPNNSQLFSIVNDLLKNNQITPTSINEKQRKKSKNFNLNIRVQAVSMFKLLNFFNELEYKNNVPFSISTLRLIKRPAKTDEELYDASFTVSLSGVSSSDKNK